MILKGKTITVGVTGGIAAYKACELVSMLKKAGADVHVVLTEHAAEFVAPLTFEALSGNRAVTDMFDRNHDWEIGHISLAKKSDVFVIAPCTANLAGKLANGIADDFLSTTLMAAKCPIILAPAMNTAMLESAAYTANAEVLKNRGVLFVESGSGRLACGDDGKGRMAEPDEIFERIVAVLGNNSDYVGKTVLVTSGGTKEPIDPVRYIGNRSSGKMGVAIAEAAMSRGAAVIYISPSDAIKPTGKFESIITETTAEMMKAVLENYERADVIIKAAAPADYSPKEVSYHKLKQKEIEITFTKNPDIAAAVGKNKGNRKLVIFSAETENTEKNASNKLRSKNADMVVANNVLTPGAGFSVDTNVATIITKAGELHLEKMSKRQLADIILDEIEKL